VKWLGEVVKLFGGSKDVNEAGVVGLVESKNVKTVEGGQGE